MVGGDGGNQFREYAGQNAGNLNGYNDVQNIRNQNLNGNGNLVAARAEGNAAGQNGNQIRCYNYRGVGHFARNCKVKPRMTLETHNWSSSAHQELYKIVKDKNFPIVKQVDARVQNFEIQFLKEAAKFVGDFKSLAKESDESLAKHKALELEIKQRFENYIIKKENEYAKLWNDWYKKCDECKYDKISYDKAYNDMQHKIEWLQAQVEDLKGKCKDTSGVSDTLNPLSQKLEKENVELKFHVLNYAKENAHLKTTYKNLFDSISVSRAQTKTIIASLQNELQNTIYENAKLRAQLFKKIGEIHALSKPVTSNLILIPQESKVVNNDKVIALGMFRINPFETSREEKHVPNLVRASTRTKPITVSHPLVFTKKDVNSDSNSLSSTGIDNSKTRRPQPRSNTKNDRVPSASKNSQSKNKEVKVEEHHRDLLLSKNNKHMSSACNNFKLDSHNDYSKVFCAICKQCLISVNHDECLLNYVYDKNSRGKKQMANVSIKGMQKKQKPKVKKPKKVGIIARRATPKPSKPRSFFRWSPAGRMFDLNGKIIASRESKSQSDYSKGDNACTSNHVEPTIKRFPNATFCLAGNLNLFMVRRLGLFQAHDRKSKASHQFRLEVYGTVRFENDHVAVILGFGDLQWGNIFITRVNFVEGLGHNLFSVGQFCDSDFEVAFRRNACFIRNLEGVYLLKGDRSTNLYTINLHEMASASPICLMDRASSIKSWLWHQRLSHLNFDTINDLAKNDLVTGLPKFKYHKEHLCSSCGQGKSKRASHPPKPIPNSRQRSKDEAPEVIKTFPKRITVLLQSPVIIIRTDNGTKFKNHVHKEYFNSVGISYQVSSVRTPQQNEVVERRNWTLVKAARTMLIFSRAPLFLWAEAIATVCFTQNRSIIHRHFNKTPYELINSKKPYIFFLHLFEALCYPKNDREDIGKLGTKVSHYPGGRNVYIRREKRDKVCISVHLMIASHTMSFRELQKRDKVYASRL
nr:hypothetical protein [Tanacetum cinerariifolium]